MTHGADNRPISTVGARAWRLALGAAAPGRWAEGLVARRPLGLGPRLAGASPADRFVMRHLALAPAGLTLLHRLAAATAGPRRGRPPRVADHGAGLSQHAGAGAGDRVGSPAPGAPALPGAAPLASRLIARLPLPARAAASVATGRARAADAYHEAHAGRAAEADQAAPRARLAPPAPAAGRAASTPPAGQAGPGFSHPLRALRAFRGDDPAPPSAQAPLFAPIVARAALPPAERGPGAAAELQPRGGPAWPPAPPAETGTGDPTWSPAPVAPTLLSPSGPRPGGAPPAGQDGQGFSPPPRALRALRGDEPAPPPAPAPLLAPIIARAALPQAARAAETLVARAASPGWALPGAPRPLGEGPGVRAPGGADGRSPRAGGAQPLAPPARLAPIGAQQVAAGTLAARSERRATAEIAAPPSPARGRGAGGEGQAPAIYTAQPATPAAPAPLLAPVVARAALPQAARAAEAVATGRARAADAHHAAHAAHAGRAAEADQAAPRDRPARLAPPAPAAGEAASTPPAGQDGQGFSHPLRALRARRGDDPAPPSAPAPLLTPIVARAALPQAARAAETLVARAASPGWALPGSTLPMGEGPGVRAPAPASSAPPAEQESQGLPPHLRALRKLRGEAPDAAGAPARLARPPLSAPKRGPGGEAGAAPPPLARRPLPPAAARSAAGAARGTGGEVTAAPAPFVAPIIARLPLAARPDAEAVDAPVASEAAAQRSPTDAEAAAPPPAGDALTRELLREFRGGRAEPPPPARPAPAPAAQAIRRAPGLDMLRPIAAPAAAPVASAVAEGAAPHLGEALRGPAALGALQGAVESATAEGQGGGQAPALDIDAIAQKVYEHLRRRLRIDQERLGRY